MIIDMILDRRDDENAGIFQYNARRFYDCMCNYGTIWDIGNAIARAMDSGKEVDVRQKLCQYLDDYGYEHIPKLKDFIHSHKWLVDDES